MSRKLGITLVVTIMIACMAVFAIASEKKTGAAEITVDGGSRGKVEFPHKLHQDELKDCMVCHDIFPQELGIIKKMKKEKELKRKQVMNKVCINCHKADKKAGKDKFGPTSCKGCHSK